MTKDPLISESAVVSAALKRDRREVDFHLSVLKAAEIALERTQSEGSLRVDGEEPGEISCWAHRAYLAAEAASDLLVERARGFQRLAELASEQASLDERH